MRPPLATQAVSLLKSKRLRSRPPARTFEHDESIRGDTTAEALAALLLSALAGCLTMATAAALQTEIGAVGDIESSAELDLVPHESGGYRIPRIRLELSVAVASAQDLDRALSSAMEMCPICNALTGSDITVAIRPVASPTPVRSPTSRPSRAAPGFTCSRRWRSDATS